MPLRWGMVLQRAASHLTQVVSILGRLGLLLHLVRFLEEVLLISVVFVRGFELGLCSEVVKLPIFDDNTRGLLGIIEVSEIYPPVFEGSRCLLNERDLE